MLAILLVLACWCLQTQCLEVTNTSLCAGTCNGPSLTFSDDLSCSDEAYWNTANGVTFRNCLECESTSVAVSGDTSTPQNNDIYWLLCESLLSRTPREKADQSSQYEVHLAVLHVPGKWQHSEPPSVPGRLRRPIPCAPDIVVHLSTAVAIRILLHQRDCIPDLCQHLRQVPTIV
jgi:hypothetical protein